MPYTHLEHAGLTDIGHRRKKNEDAILSVPESGVFVVADGMGGGSAGDVASARVVEDLDKAARQPDFPSSCIDKGQRLIDVVNATSKWIMERSERMHLSVSGSTVVMILFDADRPGRAICMHAGDSRLYRFRKESLQQLMRDHSIEAAAGLDDDMLLPAMFRGIITRAVGVKEDVQLEVTAHDVAAGDIFMLCSDGLTNMVSDGDIEMALRSNPDRPLEELAQGLLDEANAAGGVDNISALLIRVGEHADFGQGLAGDELSAFPSDGNMTSDVEAEALHSLRDLRKLGHLIPASKSVALKTRKNKTFLILLGIGIGLVALVVAWMFFTR